MPKIKTQVKFILCLAGVVLTCLSYVLWPENDLDPKSNLAIQTNIIRAIIVFECGWITAELWEIKNLMASERFSRLANRLFMTFVLFTIARVFAAIFDYALGFEIGWFSTVVNCGFFFYLGLLVRRQRIRIQNADFDSSGKRRVGVAAEEFLFEFSALNDKMKQL